MFMSHRIVATVLILFAFTCQTAAQTEQHSKNSDDRSTLSAAERASLDLLDAKWRLYFATNKAVRKDELKPENKTEAELPLPERRDFALATRAAWAPPPTISGLNATLNVVKAHKYIGSDPVFLRTYNSELVGPTLRVKRGQTLRINLVNLLTPDTFGTGVHNTLHDFNTTNLHSHGLHVSPADHADNVLEPVRSSTSRPYEYIIPADHPSGTFWYHTHWHGAVAAQVGSGMAGALIVDGDDHDSIPDLDDVPEIKAAYERIFVLQQIPYFNRGIPEGLIETIYAGDLFGPGDWDNLQRFTTVNGVRLPVIDVRPGAVERWRLIDAGFREQIKLKLERVSGSGPNQILLHEIAIDGIATGKRRDLSEIDLYPGYRADVLVKMPDQAGDYLVVDERNTQNPLLGAENRKYIAKIHIAGTPTAMSLPDSSALTACRPPSLTGATAGPNVTYEVNLNPLRFEINGQSSAWRNGTGIGPHSSNYPIMESCRTSFPFIGNIAPRFTIKRDFCRGTD